jgi:hypothetical protein
MKHLLLLIIMFVTCVANICTAQEDDTKHKVFSYSVLGGGCVILRSLLRRLKIQRW